MPAYLEGFQLSTHSLRHIQNGGRIERVLDAALKAVEPGSAVRHFMRRDGNILWVNQTSCDLSQYRRVRMIAFGKAALPMAMAAAEILGETLYEGVIITPQQARADQTNNGYPMGASVAGSVSKDANLFERIRILESSHPIPTIKSVIAAQEIIKVLSDSTPSDLLFCLISGGGSALLAAPVSGVTLDDLQLLTNQLLACGAPIHEINVLRKHLDQLKGGGLVRLAGGTRIITMILSDVIGDPLDIIASGTTVGDPSTFENAWEILEQYSLVELIPTNIREILISGLRSELKETPKPGDNIFLKVQNILVGSNIMAAQAALDQAKAEGFNSNILTTYLQGEARIVGEFLSQVARQMAITGQPLTRPACLIAGGETTVTVRGDGVGGRNQELALAAVPGFDNIHDTILISMATDGIDGPTDAAGAVVTGSTLERSRSHQLDLKKALARNDSYHFFDSLNDLLKPGFTHTNVNDLTFIFTL